MPLPQILSLFPEADLQKRLFTGYSSFLRQHLRNLYSPTQSMLNKSKLVTSPLALAVNRENALSRLLLDMEKSVSIPNDNDLKLLFRKRRKQNWNNPAEMDAFLNLLEENCEELSYLKRNRAVYTIMSYKMANLGFHREPVELQKKVANIFFQYKQEKAQENIAWPYFQRIQKILTKMKKCNQAGQTIKTEESGPEKPRNEAQKILFITSGSSNVCLDEADMETILKAMNGEDVSSSNEESSSALEIVDASSGLHDSDRAEVEDDDSRSNDMSAEPPNRSVSKIAATETTSGNQKVSNQCTASTLAIKRKIGDQDPQKIENKILISKEPAQKTQEFEACNSKKDEVDLYAALLATKLKSMDEKSRHIAMNKIDNLLFKMKMEQFEGQQRSQNLGTQHKSLLPPASNTKE